MPTTPERLIEIATRHISHNERLKSHNVKEYSEFLEDMKNSVTNQLTNKDLTKFSRDRLLALEKNIASDLKEINQAVAGTLKSQAKDLAKYESEFEVKALSDVVDYSFNLPSTSQLNSAVFKTPLAGIEGPMKGKLLDAIIKDWSDRTVDRVNNVITAGYYQGKTTTAIVKDVVGTGANFTGGTLAQVKRDTEGLVRTSLQHAANQARQETWNQNKDIVKGVRILATLDSRTSTICRSLDGQVYPLDEGPRPPLHFNCRTTTVGALDSRFKILDEDATRSARDPETGEVYKVDSQRTYYDWLKGQPANVQDSILGPTRGKLLRDGGLTSKRFAELQLSKNFQPMTLAEMKAIEPIAFEKANIDWEKAGTAPKPIDLRYSPEGKGVSKVTGPDASFRPPTSKPTVDQVQEQWAAIQDSNEFKSKVQAKADLDKKVIAARTAYSDIDTAFTNALKGDPDWDKVAKLKSKKRELGSRVVELASNQKQLAKELKQYQHEKIHTLVFPTTNAPLNARISDQYVKTKTAKSNFEKLKTEASKMLHADVVKKIGPVDIIVKKGSRAYYTNGRKEIGLANLTKTETFIHEFGHALEYQFPNAKKQALAFRKSRIGNEKLSPIFKGKKEVGWKDGFFDHYCGKYYEDGATEIISMGLEKMYKDPIIFLNKDPEYFEFIIKVMWGDL